MMSPLMGDDHNGSKVAKAQSMSGKGGGGVINRLVGWTVEGKSLRTSRSAAGRCEAVERDHERRSIRQPCVGKDATPERVEFGDDVSELRRVVLGCTFVSLGCRRFLRHNLRHRGA